MRDGRANQTEKAIHVSVDGFHPFRQRGPAHIIGRYVGPGGIDDGVNWPQPLYRRADQTGGCFMATQVMGQRQCLLAGALDNSRDSLHTGVFAPVGEGHIAAGLCERADNSLADSACTADDQRRAGWEGKAIST